MELEALRNAASGSPVQGSAQQSATGLAEDFTTFLTLLTTQLQNQDPTEPLDTNEFTNQLVQFSSVEQQIRTNQQLEDLASLFAAQNFNGAASLLGQQAVIADNRIDHTGSGGRWEYGFQSQPESVELRVLDADGTAVFETTGDDRVGLHEFVWDGLDRDGNPVPPGTYSLEVNAFNQDNGTIQAGVFAIGRVNAVNSDGVAGALFDIGASQQVSQDQILQLIAAR